MDFFLPYNTLVFFLVRLSVIFHSCSVTYCVIKKTSKYIVRFVFVIYCVLFKFYCVLCVFFRIFVFAGIFLICSMFDLSRPPYGWVKKNKKPPNKNIFKKHCIIIVMKEIFVSIKLGIFRHFYFQRLTRVWSRPLVASQ